MTDRPGWHHLRAVRNGRVCLVFSDRRGGPSLARSSARSSVRTAVQPKSGSCAARSPIGFHLQTNGGKSSCHPEGDLHSSWKPLASNVELSGAAAELPDLG